MAELAGMVVYMRTFNDWVTVHVSWWSALFELAIAKIRVLVDHLSCILPFFTRRLHLRKRRLVQAPYPPAPPTLQKAKEARREISLIFLW
ncbi:MAG: hypothetical protein ACJ8BW_29010 [Ktedonobacteraceae bacterium]